MGGLRGGFGGLGVILKFLKVFKSFFARGDGMLGREEGSDGMLGREEGRGEEGEKGKKGRMEGVWD